MRVAGHPPPFGSSDLLSLPRDLLEHVLSFLGAAEIIATASPACVALYEAAASDNLWREVLLHQYRVVLDLAFGGACPTPPAGLSWRLFFFEFRRSWMRLAKGDWESGDYHSGDGGSHRGSGRAILTIREAKAGEPHVYDVTEYVDDHPGLGFLLDAAGTDATEVFRLAGHSKNANRILREVGLVHALRRSTAPRA